MIAVAAWEYPTAIAAVLMALAAIGRAVHWVYAWTQRIDDSLSYIEGEMRFNGGSTMRDAVKRIEVRIGRIEKAGATLLDHDAERDVEGKRYQEPEGDT